MEVVAVILAIFSLLLFLIAFAKIKIFFIGNGILLHIIRVIALIFIISGLVIIFKEEESRGLLSGIGDFFDLIQGFAFVLLGFFIILSTQLTMETHLQIEENKHNIARMGLKETDKKDSTITETIFVPPSEKLQVFCPSCNTVISNQTESCPECSISLTTKQLKKADCPNCGQRRDSSKVKFCTSCGTKF